MSKYIKSKRVHVIHQQVLKICPDHPMYISIISAITSNHIYRQFQKYACGYLKSYC